MSSPENAPNDEHPRGQPGESDSTSADTRLDQERLELTVTSADLPPTITSPDSVTVIGSAVGTPRYMSPEQARGEEVGSASDMFSFGLLLHEMFTGSRAYSGPAGDELMDAIASGRTATVHGVGRHLFDLIERLESPAPSRRPTAVDATARLRWIRAKPQRRLRWAAATLLVFVAIGAGIKYTLDLRRERAAAEFRRSQSDRHIEFMVEELYKKLEPVGRVDILEEVGVKALEYFETLSEDEKTDDDRARLARTLTQLGHVRLAAGDYDAAGETFERSMAIHEGLVEVDSTSGEWLIGLSGAHFGIANVAWITDDMTRAAQHFEAYMDVSNSLIALDPDNPTYQLELGYALTNMAGLHEALGELTRAGDELRQAVAVKERLLKGEPGSPEYMGSLANTLSWLALITKDLGDPRAALEPAQAALGLRRTLARDERDTDAQQFLSISLQQVGVLLVANDRPDEAERAYREDISIAVRLSQLDPDNRDWQHGLATGWHSLGSLYVQQGRYDEARPLLENSIREMKTLMTIEPDQRDWRREFFLARYWLAMLELRQERLRQVLRILADGPVSGEPQQRLQDLLLESDAHLRLGDLAAARTALKEAELNMGESSSEQSVEEFARLRDAMGI